MCECLCECVTEIEREKEWRGQCVYVTAGACSGDTWVCPGAAQL